MWIEIARIRRLKAALSVTPLAGVWIEISKIFLKIYLTLEVTPLAGVWIEIAASAASRPAPMVTPLAGVWIEIVRRGDGEAESGGHSPRGSVD